MISFSEPAVSIEEADAYAQSRGREAWIDAEADPDDLRIRAIRRGQDYIAGRYNFRWTLKFDNSAAPDPIKFAIVEAALLEIQTPGVLSPSLERGGAVKRLRERVEGAVETEVEYMDGASVETTFTAIENLLIGAGLIRTGTTLTGFVARA